MVLTRLLEVLLIEALRSAGGTTVAPGLLRGLSDHQLASALRRIHLDPGSGITVEGLAREAAMSRSTFFVRFRSEVGVAPMEYVANWRMALAKELLLGRQVSIAEIAGRVGYASTSAFSVAFNRHVGMPPGPALGVIKCQRGSHWSCTRRLTGAKTAPTRGVSASARSDGTPHLLASRI